MIILKKINLHDEQSQAVKGFQNERIICPLIQCYNRSPIKKKKKGSFRKKVRNSCFSSVEVLY